MPKVQLRKTEYGYEYRYKCECGADVIFETDVKAEKLYKCFDCQFHDLELLKDILEEDSGTKRKPEAVNKSKKRIR